MFFPQFGAERQNVLFRHVSDLIIMMMMMIIIIIIIIIIITIIIIIFIIIIIIMCTHYILGFGYNYTLALGSLHHH